MARIRLSLLSPSLAVAAACSVDLTPGESRITCDADAQCPSQHVCAVALGECVAASERDAVGPALTLASATERTVVVLSFSEKLAPESIVPASFSIEPSLAVVIAGLRPDLVTVDLVTEPQVSGGAYDISAVGVTDAFGNAAPADARTQRFLGFGTAPDPAPPQLLAPYDGAALDLDLGLPASQRQVTLSWSARPGATVYHVEVSIGPDFTDLFADVAVEAATTHSLDPLPPAGTYFWRVTGNTTETSEAWVFGVLFDAVHVYCADTDSCDVDASRPELGTAEMPYRSVARAVSDASRFESPKRVLVAGRGGGAAYDDNLIARAGVDVSGGYSPTFGPANPTTFPTVVRGDGTTPTLTVGPLEVLTQIQDLTFETPGPAPALRLAGANLLLLRGCRFIAPGPGGPSDTVVLAENSQANFEDCEITSMTSATVTAARTVGASLDFVRTRIENLAPEPLENERVALTAESRSELRLEDCDIDGGVNPGGTSVPPPFNAVGLLVTGESHVSVRHSRVAAREAQMSHAIVVRDDSGLTLDGCEVSAGLSTLTSTAIELNEARGLNIINNLIVTGGSVASYSTGIDMFRANPSAINTIAHNTIVVGPAGTGGTPMGLSMSDSSPVVLNNLIAAIPGSTLSGYAVREVNNGRPLTFSHNVLVTGTNFAAYLFESSAPQPASLADLDWDPIPRTSCDATCVCVDGGACTQVSDPCCHRIRAPNNVVSSATLDELFTDPDGADGEVNTLTDNDWRLLPAFSEGTQAGLYLDPFGPPDCYSYDAASLCPVVPFDLEGLPRTNPPSVGAYEVD